MGLVTEQIHEQGRDRAVGLLEIGKSLTKCSDTAHVQDDSVKLGHSLHSCLN